MNKLFIIIALTLGTLAQAKLLDKVVGVINDKVITQSELSRVKSTIKSRQEISPIIYNKKGKYSNEELLEVIFRNFIVKDKLAEIGYNVTDESVESQISMTEKRNNLKRSDLLNFLRSKKFSFEEYFQVMKNTMEFNLFNSKIISPLVSISDQEIKNEYYKSTKNLKSNSFKYNLDSYTFPISKMSMTKTELREKIAKFIKTGIKDNDLKDIDIIELGELNSDDLDPNLKKSIISLNENELSKAVKKKNLYHFFYMKKKDIAESNNFLKAKRIIEGKLYMQRSLSVVNSWFDKEKGNYFIQNNL